MRGVGWQVLAMDSFFTSQAAPDPGACSPQWTESLEVGSSSVSAPIAHRTHSHSMPACSVSATRIAVRCRQWHIQGWQALCVCVEQGGVAVMSTLCDEGASILRGSYLLRVLRAGGGTTDTLQCK
jgi:hypothetical protein